MAKYDYMQGEIIGSSMKLTSSIPLDARSVLNYADLTKLVADGGAYEGQLIYVKDKNCFYLYDGESFDVFETGGGNVDDVKVNNTSVVTNKVANIDLTGYASTTSLNTHTTNNNIHITSTERNSWNAKADPISIIELGVVSSHHFTEAGHYRFTASSSFVVTGAKSIGLHCANGLLTTEAGYRYFVDIFQDGSYLIAEVSGYEAS